MDEIQKDHWEYVHLHSNIQSISVYKIIVILWKNDDEAKYIHGKCIWKQLFLGAIIENVILIEI